MRRLFVPILFGIALVSLSLAADGGAPWGWLVQKTSGTALYGLKGTPRLAVQKGVVLNRGATVRTGQNGRVLLVRSDESVFIGPHTVAAVAAHPTRGMQTTVLLQSGRTSLHIGKKSRAHFSVETPYLVAVVKGTKFNVAVTRSSAEVTVQEGRVEVKALKSGRYVDVVAGQKAVVDAAGNLGLSGKGKLSSVKAGTPRAPVVATGGTMASGGLSVSSPARVGVNTNFSAKGVAASGSVNAGGISVGVGATVGSGGVSVGVGANVGGAGIGVGASVGGAGIGVGGGVGGGASVGGGGGIGGTGIGGGGGIGGTGIGGGGGIGGTGIGGGGGIGGTGIGGGGLGIGGL